MTFSIPKLKPNTYYKISVEIITEQPTHIGGIRYSNRLELQRYSLIASYSNSELKIYKNVIVIPSTSIKGVFRRTTEYIARKIFENDNSIPAKLARAHHKTMFLEKHVRREYSVEGRKLIDVEPIHTIPSDNVFSNIVNRLKKHGIELIEIEEISDNKYSSLKPYGPRDQELRNSFKKYLDYLIELFRENPDLENIYRENLDRGVEEWASHLCPICLLYGSQHRAGIIRFTDFYILRETGTDTRTHVTISRNTRTSLENSLFSIEYLPVNTKLIGNIYIIIPLLPPTLNTFQQEYSKTLEYAEKLLENTISYLKQTKMLIGGHKSRGYGLASIVLKNIQQGLPF